MGYQLSETQRQIFTSNYIIKQKVKIASDLVRQTLVLTIAVVYHDVYSLVLHSSEKTLAVF